MQQQLQLALPVIGVWCALLALVRASNALPESRPVPFTANCTGSTNQTWQIDSVIGTIRAAAGDLCLCPIVERLDVQNEVTNAYLLPCASPEAKTAKWRITHLKTATIDGFTFEASANQFLGIVINVWPIPVGRNYHVQVTDVGTNGTPPHWTTTAEGSLVGSDGWCLDASFISSVNPPPDTSACSSSIIKDMPFCNSSLSHATRATDLTARLRVGEMAGLLSMSMPRREVKGGCSLLPPYSPACIHAHAVDSVDDLLMLIHLHPSPHLRV